MRGQFVWYDIYEHILVDSEMLPSESEINQAENTMLVYISEQSQNITNLK